MAGVKGRSGGARPGAGRKPKPPAVVPAEQTDSGADSSGEGAQLTGYSDPLVFLRAVWRGEVDANATQVRAASAALPFVHKKLGEGGKKDQRQEAAQKVASRFAPAAPPKLVAAGGKKV